MIQICLQERKTSLRACNSRVLPSHAQNNMKNYKPIISKVCIFQKEFVGTTSLPLLQTSEITNEGTNSVSWPSPEIFNQDTEDVRKINSRRNTKEWYQQRTPAAELTPLRNADTKIISSVDCIRKGVIGYDKLASLIFSHTLTEKNSISKEIWMATIPNKEREVSSKSFLMPYRIQLGHPKCPA